MTARFARQRAMGRMPAHEGIQPVVRVWYNPDLTNTRVTALAMIAQAGFMLAILLPAAGLVREKQNGTMERLRVTPIRAHALFIGKLVPPVIIATGSLFPSLLVASLLGIPMNGRLVLFLLLNLIALFSAVAIGTRSAEQMS